MEVQNNVQDSWLQLQELQDKYWVESYIQCFYWSTATIMLIGTGGNTALEIAFSTSILFFTVGIFAYILENVAQIFNQLTKDSVQYKGDLEIINKYMKSKHLDQDTQIKVRQQLEHCYISSQEINVNKLAKQVLQQLPDNLSTKICNEINQAMIQNFEILTKNFSQKTIELTFRNKNIMKETSYVSQEKIFQQNEVQDIYMYLIIAGQIEIYYQDNIEDQTHIIKVLKQGDILCQDNFFSGNVAQYSARSVKYSNVCKISRQGFINILKHNIDELEKFNYIKDQIILNTFSQYVNKPCYFCKSVKHSEKNCDVVQYKPRRFQLYLKEKVNKRFIQVRCRYYRTQDTKSPKPIFLIETMQLYHQHFILKYPEVLQENQRLERNYRIYIDNLAKNINQQSLTEFDSYCTDEDEDDYYEEMQEDQEDYSNYSDEVQIKTKINNKQEDSQTQLPEQFLKIKNDNLDNQKIKQGDSYNIVSNDSVDIKIKNVDLSQNSKNSIDEQLLNDLSQASISVLKNKKKIQKIKDFGIQIIQKNNLCNNGENKQKNKTGLKKFFTSKTKNGQEKLKNNFKSQKNVNLINNIFSNKKQKENDKQYKQQHLMEKMVMNLFQQAHLQDYNNVNINQGRKVSIQQQNNLNDKSLLNPFTNINSSKLSLNEVSKRVSTQNPVQTANNINKLIQQDVFPSTYANQIGSEELFYLMDKQQNFEIYFPRSNLKKILEIYRFKIKQQQQINLQRKQKQSQHKNNNINNNQNGVGRKIFRNKLSRSKNQDSIQDNY